MFRLRHQIPLRRAHFPSPWKSSLCKVFSDLFSKARLYCFCAYEAMSQLLSACMTCCGRRYSSICILHSISYRCTKHTSKTNTSVSSPSTRIMILPEFAAAMTQKIVMTTLPKCSIITSLHRLDLSYIEHMRQVPLIVIAFHYIRIVCMLLLLHTLLAGTFKRLSC